jgi:hypothetical protein
MWTIAVTWPPSTSSVYFYIFISFSQSTGECVTKLGREVTWEKEIKMYRIIQVTSLHSLVTHSPVDCEKEIKMYRIIQVTSLPSLVTHSSVDCEKEIKMYRIIQVTSLSSFHVNYCRHLASFNIICILLHFYLFLTIHWWMCNKAW